jgi:hypothetical protein
VAAIPTRLISGRLQTERLENGRRSLLRALVVEVDGVRIEVPPGTDTDFSSIPWIARMLVKWSRVDIAGVVHDWLYRTGDLSRARADTIWRLVALAGEHHANWLQAWLGWLGLRAGGWWAWCRHRRGA